MSEPQAYFVAGNNCFLDVENGSKQLDKFDYLMLWPFLPIGRQATTLAVICRPCRGELAEAEGVDFFVIAPGRLGHGLMRYVHYPIAVYRIFSAINRANRVYVRFPSPYAWTILTIARMQGKPRIASLHGRPRWTRFSGLALRSYGRLAEALSRVAFKGIHFVYTTSADLPSIYGTKAKAYLYRSTVMQSIPELGPPAPSVGEVRLLYVGRLTEDKSPASVILIARALASRGFEVRVDVAGSGPKEADLIELARREGVNAEFHGYISSPSNLTELYRRNHFIVLDSRSEGSPKVLIEAMAQGTVCATWVASQSIGEMLNDQNAILVDRQGEIEQYADKIAQIHGQYAYFSMRTNASRVVAHETIPRLRDRVQAQLIAWERG